MEPAIKNPSAVQKASPLILTAILCGNLALFPVAPAAAAPARIVTAPKSGHNPVALSPQTRALLRTTADRLEKTARSTPLGSASALAPKAKNGATAPQKGPTPEKNPGTDLIGSLPDLPQAAMQLAGRCEQMTKEGDQFARQGQWDAAAESYAGALKGWPSFPPALYGIAACADAAGDVRDEILYYRHAIYSDSPGFGDRQGFREEDPTRLMTFALLLQQSGQADEAVMVCNHAVVNMDYDQGKPRASLPVPLPQLGPGGAAYTPQRLQAVAEVALALQLWGKSEEQLSLLRDAVRLTPDSIAANYYLGSVEDGTRQWSSARTHYERAAQLGDASTRADVAKALRSLPPPK